MSPARIPPLSLADNISICFRPNGDDGVALRSLASRAGGPRRLVADIAVAATPFDESDLTPELARHLLVGPIPPYALGEHTRITIEHESPLLELRLMGARLAPETWIAQLEVVLQAEKSRILGLHTLAKTIQKDYCLSV